MTRFTTMTILLVLPLLVATGCERPAEIVEAVPQAQVPATLFSSTAPANAVSLVAADRKSTV